MPDSNLKFLGRRVHDARKGHKLTQQELADRTGLSMKTIQEIEKGKKNATYDTLSRLIECLEITPDSLFPTKNPLEKEAIQSFIRKLQSCSPEDQEILLNTLIFLADQLSLNNARHSE